MDARTAAELLYESEATLRMVDTVLDELQLGEVESGANGQGLWALRSDAREEGDFHAPPDFCVRGYWQVHELLDCVRQVREMISPARHQTELDLHARAEDARLDRVLSLVDALDSLDEGRADPRAGLLDELRGEVTALLGDPREPAPEDLRARSAVALLAEAEVRLTRLGHLFEHGDQAA